MACSGPSDARTGLRVCMTCFAAGGFFVLGVMLQPLKNALQQQPNPCLATALQYVPQELATDAACPTPVNPAQLLPVGAAAGQFVHYQGEPGFDGRQ